MSSKIRKKLSASDLKRKKQSLQKFSSDIDKMLENAIKSHKKGKIKKAKSLYKKVIAFNPHHPDALNLLGVISIQEERYDEAVLLINKALKYGRPNPGYYNNLGAAYKNLGRFEEALLAFKEVLQFNPRDGKAFNNIGNILNKLEKFAEAIKYFKKALELNPNKAELYNNIGVSYKGLELYEKAIKNYKKALEIKPDFHEAYNNIGSALLEIGMLEEAVVYFRKAIELKPDYVKAYENCGLALKEQGKFEDAIILFQKIIELNPGNIKALSRIVDIRKYETVDHEDIRKLQEALNRSNLDEEEAITLHFSLGKVYDDCGLYEKAFNHYRIGNRTKYKKSEFDTSSFAENTKKIIHNFNNGFFKRKRIFGSQSELPVFVVGMPRSGTTLVEQIIANHPLASAQGELEKISHIAMNLVNNQKQKISYPEGVNNLDIETIKNVAKEYLNRLKRYIGSDIVRITDKMPYNFLHLGFIYLLFPKAHIIHCKRNPLDTCLSNYFQNFTYGNHHSFELNDLGFYYQQYELLMDHWRKVLPMRMLEIQYEDLVTNPENKSKEIISFLGLEWDDQCLSFYKAPRRVKTASIWQVRQPIHSKSVGRWEKYGKFLEELKENLIRS